MAEIFEDSGGTPRTYGSPRSTTSSSTTAGRCRRRPSPTRWPARGSSPARRSRFRSLTRPDKAAAPLPDLVKRDFSASRADEKWCGDLTEIPTDEGKLYLASVLDLAARRIPGFAIGEHHDAELAAGALRMAAAIRGGDVRGVIFHTDKGSEYTADLFGKVCDRLGVTQSHGPGWVVLRQRRHRELALDPRVRVALPPALCDQGRGPHARSQGSSTATTPHGVTAAVR